MPIRHVVLGAMLLVAASSFAADKPAAVQVCFSMPEGIPLFSKSADPGYRLLGEGVFIVDLDLKLNGKPATKLTKSGADCIRAWVPAEPIHRVEVGFERPAFNLASSGYDVDLKLKADLWYDAGRVTVTQLPWSTAKVTLPGELKLERKDGDSFSVVSDLKQVPAGVYRVSFQLPSQMRKCDVTIHSTALGSIREDNRKAVVHDLVDVYLNEYVPEVLADLKLACDPGEALQLELLMIDGVYFKPREPKITKIKVPGKAPQYAINIDGVRTSFTNGQLMTVHSGEHISLEEVLQRELSATR